MVVQLELTSRAHATVLEPQAADWNFSLPLLIKEAAKQCVGQIRVTEDDAESMYMAHSLDRELNKFCSARVRR